MARPANTALAYLIISMATFITASLIGLWLMIIPLVIFVLFVAIMGVGGLRKNIGGLYSGVSVMLNIIAIITSISIFIASTQAAKQPTNNITTTQQIYQ